VELSEIATVVHRLPLLSRRRLLQAGAAAAGAAGLTAPAIRLAEAGGALSRRPNFLILMCDEMRFPPVYESAATKEFRLRYLKTQDLLRRNGVDFRRHYVASVACSPSRTSLYTGQYPSLHGVTNTDGAAKAAFDPDVFWLDPNSVPTLGDYFRAAGYRTFWRGKWHASEADMTIPGTHNQLLSYDATSGAPDPANEALYMASDRLGGYGFTGWIGPEPHGPAPLNSGSSVPPDQQGRDVGFAQQTASLIEQLEQEGGTEPWFIMSSFVNPHDIVLFGLFANLGGGFDFAIEEGVVPYNLFDPALFQQTVNDNLALKPSAQASYQKTYPVWQQPILNQERYFQYYYQLHKNVDEQMMVVYQTLLRSRFRDDTIVLFTSDHGSLVGAHHGMYQKWYTAYDEAIRVPLIVSNPALFRQPRVIDTLTSHIDLLPTLLGLAGIDPAPIRERLSVDHSDARPLVGRNLSALVLGLVPSGSINDPLYFMTDDDPSRGLDQATSTGVDYSSVVQPNHIETVIAQLAGKVWKYSRYFDNPQFWSSPGDPGQSGVEDVVSLQRQPTPREDGTYPIGYEMTIKHTPAPDEFEMYNVTDDPMELHNLCGNGRYTTVQTELAALLQQQCARKRLVPCSGEVPGEPECGQQRCSI
jgi:choline-sulfatase